MSILIMGIRENLMTRLLTAVVALHAMDQCTTRASE